MPQKCTFDSNRSLGDAEIYAIKLGEMIFTLNV